MKTIKCYRWLTDDMKSRTGDVEWRIGGWKKHDGTIALCEEGFHASIRPLDVLSWNNLGTRLFTAEARGDVKKDHNKIVASEMRVVKEIPDLKPLLVRFAIDCANRVLLHFEKERPDDLRPRKAIAAAEKWLCSRSNVDAYAADDADAAARAADDAYAAASYAAAAAADAAAYAAASYAPARAADAADAAAYAAARAADAADAAAGTKEKEWQNKRLEELFREALEE